MNNIKSNIMEKLSNQELENIEELILAYEQEAPDDLELISIKVMYFLLNGNYEEALGWASFGVRKNPYNTEAIYNLAYVNETIESYYEAYKYYCKAFLLAKIEENQEILNLNLEEKFSELSRKYMDKASLEKDENAIKSIIEQLELLQEESPNGFGLLSNPFKDYKTNIGVPYRDYSGNEVYVGYYGRSVNRFNEPNNMIQAKGEMRPIIANGNQFQMSEGCERIVPILSETVNTLVFHEDNQEYTIPINNPNHFSHYRVKPNTKISAENPVRVGKPIPIMYDPSKKKLVLSLFVDGLSQVVLEEEGVEKIMPNTYRFFSKGAICKNTYSTSEWTYPSLATYMTGLDTTHHMMMHNTLNISLPDDVTLLTEYFSQAGYQTAKIDGDWRTTPNYGYSRGVDRVIFQHQWTGMRTQEVVNDAIEHMELMKDTNHYLWVGLGDLHDIADGIDLQASVESQLHVKERVVEQGVSSAKQPYSKNKRIAYIHQAKMIDRNLGIMYDYIEQNYKDEEIVVSLFADHGQGYLIEPGKFFLSPERTRVAFMFRGGEIKPTVSEELISTADYSTIMCKLCNIVMRNEMIDGKLPQQFGGEIEREYVIAESIHPKDCYCISVYWKNYVCNFKSADLVGEDGRFHLQKGYSIQMLDYNNHDIIDDEKKDRNLEIIMSHIAGLLIYD